MEGAGGQGAVVRVREGGFERLATIGLRTATAIAVVAAALAAWPVETLEPGVGGDWNWIAALSYAAHYGLRFGGQIAWSYGPLGFLTTSDGPVLYYDDVLRATWLFTALIQLLLAGTLLLALRRSLPLPIAVVGAAVVLALVPDRTLALGFAWCAVVLARRDDRAGGLASTLLACALGALSGIVLLGKLNQGIALLALAAVALSAAPRRRDVGAYVGTLLASAAAGWLATGQTLADVWPYLRNGAEVIAGYAGAMGLADPAHRWMYAVALALTLLTLAAAWEATRGAPPRRRRALLVLCALYVAASLKEGFVRQDMGHMLLFLGDMLIVPAVLPLPRTRRWLVLGGLVAAIAPIGVLVPRPVLERILNPVANVRAAADQIGTLRSASRRGTLTWELRERITSGYGFGPELATAIGQRTVMFWPHLFADIAYAYGLNLRPEPTLEPYSAYTPALDRLTARMLASARAPELIVHAAIGSAPAIDGRFATFEAPLATLAILCRYRGVMGQGSWQLLARSPDRCGRPRALGDTTAPWGAPVAVPSADRPDALVLVRVEGAGPSGLERLKALLLRPNRRWISLDGTRFRLVAATAADGLLLRAPPQEDYRPPFAIAPNPARIAVGRDGGEPGGRLRYAFLEVPIRP
jgi:hypothetical protein